MFVQIPRCVVVSVSVSHEVFTGHVCRHIHATPQVQVARESLHIGIHEGFEAEGHNIQLRVHDLIVQI